VDSSVDAAFDIIVSGGTLGIFYALALQNLGFKTCIVERGKVVGRTQEWNICMNEVRFLSYIPMVSTI
jgi:lycopene cyclase CruP